MTLIKGGKTDMLPAELTALERRRRIGEWRTGSSGYERSTGRNLRQFDYLRYNMRRSILIALGCLISVAAFAQEKGKGDAALAKWRSCADATAKRYAKSAESAPVVARYAIMSCHDEKKAAAQALTEEQGSRFADEFIETLERRYTDLLAIDVIELRLKP
ncbi:hypothetical protein [Bosea robiniae]|uniref:hypothetical protein n=1 Tax=Bosea robiniae TaxID=1036780 RepID=UPI000B80C03E|nr:hypothetical protein [Bosea robiniae]